MRKLTSTTSVKVLASTALVAGAATVAGLGTFGAFTSTTDSAQAVASGTVELGTTNGATVSSEITGLVPGDTIDRLITLERRGSERFGKLYLTTGAEAGGFVAAKPQDFRFTLDHCSTGWVEADKKQTCAVPTTPLLAGDSVLVAKQQLAQAVVNDLNDEDGLSTVRMHVEWVQDENRDDNDLQGKSAALKLTFDATQRAGEAR